MVLPDGFSTNKMEEAKGEKQNTHSRPFTAPQLYPSLVFLDRRQGQEQIFFDISNNQTEYVPEMCNKVIYACSHGWLVLGYRNSMDCYLWNPISLEKVQLPPLEFIGYGVICALSASPSDPECHVLFFHRWKNTLLVCQPGDLEFNEQDDVFPEDYIIWNFAVVGKTIYGLTTGYTLFAAEFVGPNIQFTRLAMEALPCPYDLPSFKGFLIESCGELFLVHISFHHPNDVDLHFVFQMDFEGKKWVRLRGIGNRSIFISENHRTCCMHSIPTEFLIQPPDRHSTSAVGFKPNSVYFARDRERLLYNFDLESLSRQRSLPSLTAISDSDKYWVMI